MVSYLSEVNQRIAAYFQMLFYSHNNFHKLAPQRFKQAMNLHLNYPVYNRLEDFMGMHQQQFIPLLILHFFNPQPDQGLLFY
jgi:hypothetical protein